MKGLSLKEVTKSFGEDFSLRNISFNLNINEVVALLGPSGCGKSTLLNIIAGIEKPDSGLVTWNGVSLADTPPHKRDFGLMFQDYLLFPHKNVASNIGFGLEMRNYPKEKIEHRVKEVLKLTNLIGYEHRDVSTLSGGEQQRVALARSLAPKPKLLMLDEPLGSLDRALRELLLHELSSILRSMNQTALYVTHDQEEAFSVTDRVIVMNKGAIAQIGTPKEIYQHPNSEYVARFLGLTNIFTGNYLDGWLNTEIGNFDIKGGIPDDGPIPTLVKNSRELKLLLRPDSMRLDNMGTHHINGTVVRSDYRGSFQRVTLKVKENTLIFEFPAATQLPSIGNEIRISFNLEESIQILS